MRKKKTIIEESLPEEQPTTDTVEPTVDLTQYFKLYRINNGSRGFCLKSQELIDEEQIQLSYPNGGKFIVIEYGEYDQPLRQTTFDIEPKPMPMNGNGNGHHSNNSSDIQVRMLMDEIQWTRQMLMTMLGRNTQQTPITELVTAMQGLQSFAPTGKNPVDLIVKGLEIGTKMNGGGSDWKTELISTAKEVLAPAITMLAAQQQQPPGNQQMIANAIPKEAFIKQGLVWLKSQILAGMEVEVAVNWLLRTANDATYQPFLALAVNGGVDEFIRIDTELANEPYRTWFTRAVELIKEAYSNANTDTDDTDIHG